MKCFHCKKTINPKRESHQYVTHWEGGVRQKRVWCAVCCKDETIVEAEYPKHDQPPRPQPRLF